MLGGLISIDDFNVFVIFVTNFSSCSPLLFAVAFDVSFELNADSINLSSFFLSLTALFSIFSNFLLISLIRLMSCFLSANAGWDVCKIIKKTIKIRFLMFFMD